MFGLESLSGNAQAVVLVGAVLIEAIVLYVGYGGLEKVFGPTIKRVLQGQCPLAKALSGDCQANGPSPKQ